MRYYRLFILILFLFSCTNYIEAYNLRQFSSKNGLSNSSILSIHQQNDGLLWFGTCDGLNIFDGVNLKTYSSPSISQNFSGNMIEYILEAEESVLWIQTNYGLDRLDFKRQTIENFYEFNDSRMLAKSQENDIFVIQEDNYIYYYQSNVKDFRKVYIPDLLFDDILLFTIDKNNVFWIFTSDGQCRNFSIQRSENEIKLVSLSNFNHPKAVRWCFVEDDNLYYVDETNKLYEYELTTKQEKYIYNLNSEISQRGEISSIIKQRNDFYIGFKSSGLISLMYNNSHPDEYEVIDIAIKSGIFCLLKDKYQDIIWVGSDGQGVFMHFSDMYSITSIPSNSIYAPIHNPIRALFMDKEKSLWIGTKGDGIVRLKNYSHINNTTEKTEHFMTGNSSLADNSVYCFAESRKNILWIGSENGVNYYSYREQQIKPIIINMDNGKPIKYVHSICELNDSILWIATVGQGMIKVNLAGNIDNPVIKAAKAIVVDDGKRSSNHFFTIYKENDSILWFGNRGLGAYRLNSDTEKMQRFRFDESKSNQTVNDIFSIHKTTEGYWFGTSHGVKYISNGKKQIFNTNSHLAKNTIHGILEDSQHNLWLSTNKGIVRFNINHNTTHTYQHQNEMITEFSDGAYFKDTNTGTLFFGGIDGFITIQNTNVSHTEFMPRMKFSDLSIYGKDHNIFDFTYMDNKLQVLKLNYDQNFFSISFMAPDYIDGNNYTYYYKVEGSNNDWVDNGISSTTTFTSIPHGTYKLLVKYRNNTTGKESQIQSLKIIILAPWYHTHIAYIFYFLLAISFLFFCVKLVVTWYRIKRDKIIDTLNRQQRDEVYESKLRFFTNITHEFCTPLTLISGPCEKILSYPKTDNYVQKYATSIQRNAERLNDLIQELIEFRRIETGNKKLQIKNLQVSNVMTNISTSFSELAETNNINYQLNIPENIWWNTDSNCLNKVITNLISNAFKYTPEHGTITAELFADEQQLHIIISNTGKGIKEEDLNKIFDRYKILDSFETQTKNNFSPRNGLGLAICHSIVTNLEGEIKLSSIPNEITTFEVLLPQLSITEVETPGEIFESPITNPVEPVKMPSEMEPARLIHDKKKPTVMIIDDDPSMLWFISEIFVDHYNIIPLSDPKEVMEALKINLPDLIISDVMMPDIDGLSLTKTIKSNKLFSHIPLILLSARIDIEEQMKGIESGAEIYITKPFNVQYLEKIVSRFLKREEEMKDYYGSVYSSFKLDDGHFIHKEDKEFFEKMMNAIDKNISNLDLSVESLSSTLGYGTRQFYRKLKNITQKTPADIIKEYRLSVAEKLLLSTSLSIDEICTQIGFNNRGNFYKIFVQKFGTTPKKYRIQKQEEFKKISEKE